MIFCLWKKADSKNSCRHGWPEACCVDDAMQLHWLGGHGNNGGAPLGIVNWCDALRTQNSEMFYSTLSYMFVKH